MYTVAFYQCGVQAIEAETYSTLKEARHNACEFLRDLLPMPGHKREGSIYRDGSAGIFDYSGGTEARVNITKEHRT